MTSFVFITGGVVSGLGKGIITASLSSILEAQGWNVETVKLDPYINVDPGTMNPIQHGEVFVTEDGMETDLDLGYYERFTESNMTRANNFTSGSIYKEIVFGERFGCYLGGTVQVIPHVTESIKKRIRLAGANTDIVLIEVGGTVGDIESLPFLEAARQIKIESGLQKTLFIHLTLLPYIATANEIKTKPTQHSVKELRSTGINPDILVCRSVYPISYKEKEKISLLTDVNRNDIISVRDAESVYDVPSMLNEIGFSERIVERLGLESRSANLSDWKKVGKLHKFPEKTVRISMVGKYTELMDSYKSVNESITHAGIKLNCRVVVDYIDSETIEKNGTDVLKNSQGILVPGGFGSRGIEGKIQAVKYSRKNNIPYLGICLGMQVALIEFARNCAAMPGANSTEFDKNPNFPVISLVDYEKNNSPLENYPEENSRGKMRLGDHLCYIKENTLAHSIYKNRIIIERHRHKYEVNSHFVEKLQNSGLLISGCSSDYKLVEIIEIPHHKFFFLCQFHP